VTVPAELHWTLQAGYPILGTLQLLPVAVMLLLVLLRRSRLVYPVALVLAVAELLVALDLYRHFDSAQEAMQLAERLPFMASLGYHAAADGMTVLFMLLTALLSLMVILYARIRRVSRLWRFLVILFGIEAAIQSMFATQDLLWFTLLSTVELLLIAYLLSRWANAPQEDIAMQRFLQFMGTGLLLLLAGSVMLAWNHADATGGRWSFDLTDLAAVPVPVEIQTAIFFLLFYGVGIRIPLFPLHGWLPLIAEHGTVAVAGVFLLGLKTGVYALLRFVFPLLPEAVAQWHKWVAAFALAGIFYAATLALRQVNLRRLLAFAVVSHTSVLVIGLFSLSRAAFQGSILLSVNFGLATAGLLFMSGIVFRHTHTLLLPRLGGLFDKLPFVGTAFLIAGLSIIGMPGTPGFDAAHLMLEAAIEQFGALVTIAAALGNVAAAAFLLWAFQRAFLAPANDSLPRPEISQANRMERLIAGMMIVMLLGTGFYSSPWLELTSRSFNGTSARYEHLQANALERLVPHDTGNEDRINE
jgi:NADH-quinone oxidoreductase subunit M